MTYQRDGKWYELRKIDQFTEVEVQVDAPKDDVSLSDYALPQEPKPPKKKG